VYSPRGKKRANSITPQTKGGMSAEKGKKPQQEKKMAAFPRSYWKPAAYAVAKGPPARGKIAWGKKKKREKREGLVCRGDISQQQQNKKKKKKKGKEGRKRRRNRKPRKGLETKAKKKGRKIGKREVDPEGKKPIVPNIRGGDQNRRGP